MIQLPALPLPRVYKGFDIDNVRSFCMVFGPALLVQWLLPWGGGGLWSWSGPLMGSVLWSLIAGIGLTVLAFAPIPNLKTGHIFAAAAGAGVVGIAWSTASGGVAVAPFFFNSLFGLLGLAAMSASLFLWAKNGHNALYQNVLWGGVVGLGLGLLIPIGGDLPLIGIFKVLGQDGINIIARIFFMLFSLAYIFLLVVLVMNVLLKGASADRQQVERIGLVLFFFPFAALFLTGFFSFFTLWGIAMHNIVMLGSYLVLATYGLTNLFQAITSGQGVASLLNHD